MRPATQAPVSFAESNTFALALVGIEARCRAVAGALPIEPADPRDSEPYRETEHPLDLALLGLVSLAERLGRLGLHDDVDADDALDPAGARPGSEDAATMTATEDLLR